MDFVFAIICWKDKILLFLKNDNEAKKFKHGGIEGQKIGFFSLKEMEGIKLTPKLKERLLNQRTSLERALKEKSFQRFSF